TKKKTNNQFWVRPIFTLHRHFLQGASENLVKEMEFEDETKFRNYFRMDSITLKKLLELIGPLITKQSVVREPIPSETRLHITLRYLASGDSMMSIAPPRSGSCYYNYKGNHSINLLAVSDAKNRFTIVDIGAEGRQSDGGVFENSGLPHLLETNALHIPLPTRLNNTDLEFPYVLLGDEAFSLSTYMMRPYPRSAQLNISRKIFNYRLSRARRTVECAFGILVARWRLYRQFASRSNRMML
ncbi:hypothetical protein ALC57_15503, partial [Trachymyrmex cornetzi]